MHKLAISTACVALVFGLGETRADTPEDRPEAKTRRATENVASRSRARRASASAPPKRRARATLSASRERRLQSLGRDLTPPTPEDLLAEELDEVWGGRHLRRGTTAVHVVDAVTGEPLYSIHSDEHLNPASNVKLIATATILDLLGPEWRYLTRILGPTPSPQGIISGDLYLLGSYDPTLERDHIEDMAEDIAESGVEEINGDLYVGDGSDALSRDSIYRPRIAIRVKGGRRPGDPPEVTVSPDSDYVRIESQLETTQRKRRRARIEITSEVVDGDSGPVWRIELTGTIGARRRATYRRRVPRGQVFTAHMLRAALSDRGVTVRGAIRQAPLPDYVASATTYLPVELARHESISMRELVAKINKRSINYLADRAIMTAGAVRYGGPPTMDKGVRAMHEWLRKEAGVDPEKLSLDTGSGLSYNTELTARQIVRVLRVAGGFTYAAGEEDVSGAEEDETGEVPHEASQLERVFLESLAIGGVDGTLRGRFRRGDTRGKVIGKTGTLTRVIALSGIVREDDGNALAFSIITNGHKHHRRRRVRKEHEDMVEAMQRYLRARHSRD